MQSMMKKALIAAMKKIKLFTRGLKRKKRGRGKVKSNEKRRKTHAAAKFDESVDQMSTEEEGPTATQAKRTNKSVRKKVTRKEYRWKKAEFEPPDVQFDESADAATEERSKFTTHMYFKQFVIDEMLQTKQTCSLYRNKDGQ